MNAYDRPTDSLPISRRTVIMNTGLAAAAIAGLSSCTTYGTAPVSELSAPAASDGEEQAQVCQPRPPTFPSAAVRSSPTHRR